MQEQWSSADAYSYLVNLGAKALAWEFMRRNAKYRVAYRSISSKDGADMVAQHWGCANDPDLRADRVQIIWLPTAWTLR